MRVIKFIANSYIYDAPVAQLDRVSASEAEGHGFKSRRARQIYYLQTSTYSLISVYTKFQNTLLGH